MMQFRGFVYFVSIFTVIYSQKCGQTPISPNLNSKIIGGTTATPFSWPFQAIFCYFNGRLCEYGCGGTLIGDRWAMTAGHCVYGNTNNPGSFGVKTGAFDISLYNEPGVAVYKIKKIHLHPKYTPYPLPHFDVALLELHSSISFDNHTQPICLPISDSSIIVETNTAWSTGWGTTEEGHGADKLRQVNLPFVNYDTCEAEAPGEIVEDVMICTGIAGKGPCQGDSGGPLMVKNSAGAWFQYGLTSFGTGDNCADPNKPSVYSRITAYCDFIQSATNGEVTCQDSSTYA